MSNKGENRDIIIMINQIIIMMNQIMIMMIRWIMIRKGIKVRNSNRKSISNIRTKREGHRE